jgi:hypothetical protein
VAVAEEAPPRAAAEEGAPEPLEPLGRLVGGEWVARGAEITEAGASLVEAVARYEWGTGRKAIRSRSYTIRDDQQSLEFESLLAWHPQDRTLVFFGVTADGSVLEGTVTGASEVFEFNWEQREEGAVASYRQVLRFTDEDEYVLTLSRRTGRRWAPLTETTFRRR